MANTKNTAEIEKPSTDSPSANPLDEHLRLLARKIDFFVEQVGVDHQELLKLREEVQKALLLESSDEKAEVLARGEKLIENPQFETAIENLANDPLLFEKADASEAVFDELQHNPKSDLAKLEVEKFVKNPELLTAISENPEIWEKIKREGAVGITVVEILKNPKRWDEKIGETGESIAKFAKRNPEFTSAAVVGLTLGGILMLLGKSKIKKAFGAVSLGVAGFLGFKKWGEAIGFLAETGLKKLGISQKTIDEWKTKKDEFKKKGGEIKTAVIEKKDVLVEKIDDSVDKMKNWKAEVADLIGEQIEDDKLDAILAKWSAGKKLSEEDRMSVSERLLHNGFLFVVVDGVTYLAKGATFFPVKWAKGVGNSVHGLFSRGIERGVIEYAKGGALFAVFGGSVEMAKAIFTTSTKKSIFKSFLKGAAKGGVNYGYKIPIIILKSGGIVEKFIYDVASKGITGMAAEGLAKAAARAERPLAKSVIRKAERQLLKLCGEGATKKFIQSALKKTGMKKVGQFLAKRAAAAGGSAMTGVGTAVSVGILAWTLYDVGMMSIEGYKLYDLKEKLTERGAMPIKNIYLDATSQKKLSKSLPKNLENIEELKTLDIFKKLPMATLFIEREGKNDREKWEFKNGEVVDIQIEQI